MPHLPRYLHTPLSLSLLTSTMRLASTKIKAANQPPHEENKKRTRRRQKHGPLRIPPPNTPPQLSTAALKPKRLLIQSIRLIHQQFDLLPSFQHLLDILHHDSLHVLDLIPHRRQTVDVTSRVVVVIHPIGDDAGEFFVEGEGDGALRNVVSVLGGEVGLDFVEEGEGYAMAGFSFVGHAEEAYSRFYYVVKRVFIVNISHTSIDRRYLRQKHSRHRGEISCRRRCRILGEDRLLT
mmetsp:Transcript_14449/g.27548  ORF Transcript_14449/g.27548 Transcript_14449/m.27548 type:complete len:236 (-) Transcript_14449:107-814(-)